MPSGIVEIGLTFERKNHCSNIVCLVCPREEKEPYFAQNMKGFVKHILKEHPKEAHFLRLRNYRKMII